MQGISLRDYYLRLKQEGEYKLKYLPEDEVVVRRNGMGLLARVAAPTHLDDDKLYNINLLYNGIDLINVPETDIFEFDEKIPIPVQLHLRM